MNDEGKKQEPKDLQIRTKEFALRVIRMYSALPKSTEAQVLGKQVLRSGTSVGANYREANRAVQNRSSSPRSGTVSRNSTKPPIGLTCWPNRRLFPMRNLPTCAMNAINSSRSSPPSQKRRRPMPHNSSFILHPSSFILRIIAAIPKSTKTGQHADS